MSRTLEIAIPVYKSKRFSYVRICDLKEEYERRQLNDWIFGHFQPLIQGEKGAIIDAVLLQDYERFIRGEKLPLTFEEICAILEASNDRKGKRYESSETS